MAEYRGDPVRWEAAFAVASANDCSGNGVFNGSICICDAGWCPPNCASATNLCGTCSNDCTVLRGIGVTLAVVGNAVIALSFNLQKKAHLSNEQREKAGEKALPFIKIPVWWIGIVLMAVGELGNFMAYGWAPATMVAPLGAVNIVVNAFISRVWLKQPIPRRAIAGMVLAILGSIDISLTAPEADEGNMTLPALANDMRSPLFIAWGCFLLVGAIVFVSLPKRLKHRYVIIYIMFCTHVSSFVIISIKGVSIALQILVSGNQQTIGVTWSYWLTYVLLFTLIGTLLLQIKFLNKAMEYFSTAEVVPVFFVTFNLYSIATGMILFNETTFQLGGQDTPLAIGIPLFLLGILTTFLGVFLIAWKKVPHHVPLQEEADEGVEIPTERSALLSDDQAKRRRVVGFGESSRSSPVEGEGGSAEEGEADVEHGEEHHEIRKRSHSDIVRMKLGTPRKQKRSKTTTNLFERPTRVSDATTEDEKEDLIFGIPRCRVKSQRYATSLILGP